MLPADWLISTSHDTLALQFMVKDAMESINTSQLGAAAAAWHFLRKPEEQGGVFNAFNLFSFCQCAQRQKLNHTKI